VIVYPNHFHFYAAPGTDVRRIIKLMQWQGQRWFPCVDAYSRGEIPTDSLPTVSLVCHPFRWIERCYRDRIFNLPTIDGLIETKIVYTSFYHFVMSIYDTNDDVFGRLHRQYPSMTCWREEDLPDALLDFLHIPLITPVPRHTNRIIFDDNLGWTSYLRQLVLTKEQEICETYDYY